jgi:hypothetical protein
LDLIEKNEKGLLRAEVLVFESTRTSKKLQIISTAGQKLLKKQTVRHSRLLRTRRRLDAARCRFTSAEMARFSLVRRLFIDKTSM